MRAIHDHAVQFYEDESYLCEAVTRFLGPGFRFGQPAVIIATPPHLEAFIQRLKVQGFNVDGAISSGRFISLDARETLLTFTENEAMPDTERFKESIGNIFEKSRQGKSAVSVRAFEEMTDLLWRDGRPEAALCLEELWNLLAASHLFSLCCGYDMTNFSKEEHTERFRAICLQHAHVFPTERYSHILDENAQLREVAYLQQRALALDTEIQRQRAEAERGKLAALEKAAGEAASPPS
jgi:DcmR-like sensory protein